VGRRAIIGLVAIAAAGLAPAASAHPVRAGAVSTFDGACRLTGELKFREPLGNEPRATTFTDTATGTCTGTLNGGFVNDVPVANRASGSGTLGCLAGHATTTDLLTFAQRNRLRILTDITGGLTQFGGPFSGAVSGDGVVEVNFLPYTDPALLEACQAGALRTARYDLVARTITPVVG
jgi:hypothetical protein